MSGALLVAYAISAKNTMCCHIKILYLSQNFNLCWRGSRRKNVFERNDKGSSTLAMGKCLWFFSKSKSLSIAPFFTMKLP